jgi:hypothetical protein
MQRQLKEEMLEKPRSENEEKRLVMETIKLCNAFVMSESDLLLIFLY